MKPLIIFSIHALDIRYKRGLLVSTAQSTLIETLDGHVLSSYSSASPWTIVYALNIIVSIQNRFFMLIASAEFTFEVPF